MLFSKDYRSPHFEDKFISVEFVVLHYTAQSLKESLNIFLGSRRSISCHLLIDRDGSVYELVDCRRGGVKKAFHAGQSCWTDGDNKKWENFNNFSIGVELVNWNGNFFSFTSVQYTSLFQVLKHFRNQHPQLNKPDRILGHEHIAGFRGKKDPGALFDWSYLFKELYSTQNEIRKSVLTAKELNSLSFLKNLERWNDKKARQISLILENESYPFWMKKWLCAFIIQPFF